jgi:cell cycle checkpoint control protein RAD9A
MSVVNFTLSEEGVAILRDALTCLNKFNDDVSLEARRDKVRYISLAAPCFSNLVGLYS